ncbi:MAG TPA: class I SAM-dependent methyltransferase [Acidimicrobiales bacterium]|nr:class I SAM-dependent methyltransferase [Acidimicrobiales bacterium]
MEERTGKLWAKQDQHEGDRWRLFNAVAGAIEAERVLYPGCYVDVSASFAFADVTYVDVDARAARFFADEAGVEEIIAEHPPVPDRSQFRFIHSDYSADLGLEDESFDLLVSLYAGFSSESCTRYLRVGGTLLVNPSHGDASMAAIDDRYELTGVVVSRAGGYGVRTHGLDGYLIPKGDIEITAELLHERGRGIAYTKTPFAYLFRRVG